MSASTTITGLDSTTPGTSFNVGDGTNKAIRVNVVAGGGGGGGNVNLIQVGGSAIAIGQAAMAASLPVVIASNQSAIPVSSTPTPVTTGGLGLPYRNINLGSTGVNIKGSAGQVYGWIICNNATAPRFVKFYNKATAPTVGTDTPVMTIELPASSTGQYANSFGIAFATGIGIGATVLVADNDTTNTSTNDVVVNILYN